MRLTDLAGEATDAILREHVSPAYHGMIAEARDARKHVSSVKAFNADEARDRNGRWTLGDGTTLKEHAKRIGRVAATVALIGAGLAAMHIIAKHGGSLSDAGAAAPKGRVAVGASADALPKVVSLAKDGAAALGAGASAALRAAGVTVKVVDAIADGPKAFGVYRPFGKRIEIASRPNKVPAFFTTDVTGTTLHELGHAIDDIRSGGSGSAAYKTAWKADQAGLDAKAHPELRYFTARNEHGRSESFAELFAQAHGHSNVDLAKAFPRSAAYVRDFVKRLG